MDLIADQTFDGQKGRGLTIVDTLSRVSQALEGRRRHTGYDVVWALSQRLFLLVWASLSKTKTNSFWHLCPPKEVDVWAYANGGRYRIMKASQQIRVSNARGVR